MPPKQYISKSQSGNRTQVYYPPIIASPPLSSTPLQSPMLIVSYDYYNQIVLNLEKMGGEAFGGVKFQSVTQILENIVIQALQQFVA